MITRAIGGIGVLMGALAGALIYWSYIGGMGGYVMPPVNALVHLQCALGAVVVGAAMIVASRLHDLLEHIVFIDEAVDSCEVSARHIRHAIDTEGGNDDEA